jgi:serine-type D-Ala-D-Ala carboxypeptidase (penicillin-binding protein 5/6)
VILGAQGENHLQGERNRAFDATRLLDYGFDHFRNIELTVPRPEPVRVWGGRVRYVTPVVRVPRTLTVAVTDLENISGQLVQEYETAAPVSAGAQVGSVRITAADTLLLELPVLVESPVDRGVLLRVVWDAIVKFFRHLFG